MGKIKEWAIINVAYRIADLKFHTSVTKWYNRIAQMRRWTPQEIVAWQEELLRKRIEHAYNHIPYYKKLFDNLDISPSDINSIADLEKIPIMTKEEIIKHTDELIPDDISKYGNHKVSTGGTSGNPLAYISDNASWGFLEALRIHGWKQSGFRYGDKFAALGSTSIGVGKKKSVFHKMYYALRGKVAMSSKTLSEKELARYASIISEQNIHYIYGYGSSIFLFTRYVTENNLSSTMEIRAVFPTSDLLTDIYVEAIKKAWGCEIIDSYGAHDGSIGAYRRIGEPGFKVGYNTIVQTDNSLGANHGNAILTDLIGMAFPFIRYDVCDVVELDTKASYSADYNGQVIKTLVGRVTDVIKLSNGHYLTGISLNNLFKDLPILGYRVDVIHDDEIRATIVPSPHFTNEDQQELQAALEEFIDNNYTITIAITNELEKRPNGKSVFLMV